MAVRDAWRARPLAWIHRAEARSVAGELAAAGRETSLVACDGADLSTLRPGRLLLRLSDPVMWRAVRACSGAGISYA